ncbi:MAG: methyltransferase domain-containing protein [Planctomycetota bacterium]
MDNGRTTDQAQRTPKEILTTTAGILDIGNHDDAASYIKHILKTIVPSQELLFDLCELYITRNFWEIPPFLMEKVIALDDRLLLYFRRLAKKISSRGCLNEACAMLQACVKSAGQDSRIWCELGRAHQALGEWPESERSFEEALRLDPENEEAAELLDILGIKQTLGEFCPDDESALLEIDSHAPRYVEILKLLTREKRGARLLDLGASPHRSLLYDAYLELEIVANRHQPGGRSTGSVELKNATGQNTRSFYYLNFNIERDVIPFDSGTFDVVAAFDVLEKVAHDPMFLIKEANRVLKPGGRLLIATPNIVGFKSLARVLDGRAPYSSGRFAFPYGSPRHFREYTPWELEALLQSGGFDVELLFTKDLLQPESIESANLRSGERIEALVRDYEEQKFDFLTPVPAKLRKDYIFAAGTKAGSVKERYPKVVYEDCWESIVL